MFNQQVLILYAIALSPFPLVYISIKAFEWLQRNLFYSSKDNEQIGREGLMIQLEEVRKQRDEITTQLMIFRLQSQKADSNEPIREPELYKGLVDHLKKTNHETKMELHEVHLAYTESQRKLNELETVSIRFIKDFECDYVLDGEIVDNPRTILVENYKAFKSVLGQV